MVEHGDGGFVVEDGDVKIEAFDVPHGDIKPAFGYRITTPDKVVVISGDTNYSEKLAEMAKGADILVHEVICQAGLDGLSQFWQDYHNHAHTTTGELARIANAAKPGKLLLTHLLLYGQPVEQVLKEIRAEYPGEVVAANDLDTF